MWKATRQKYDFSLWKSLTVFCDFSMKIIDLLALVNYPTTKWIHVARFIRAARDPDIREAYVDALRFSQKNDRLISPQKGQH